VTRLILRRAQESDTYSTKISVAKRTSLHISHTVLRIDTRALSDACATLLGIANKQFRNDVLEVIEMGLADDGVERFVITLVNGSRDTNL
jgi:hypothetical protein